MSEQQQDDANLPARARDDEQQPGFWRRMFGGPGRPEVKDVPAVAGDDGAIAPARPRAPEKKAKNPPRAPKADDEAQRRFARAAMLRRERLARAIGERVEQVLVDRMAEGEQRLAEAQEGFAEGMGEVGGLLKSIGRNLDQQADRGERVATILEALPGASEREREALELIARTVEQQGTGTNQGLEALRGVLTEVGRGLDAQGERAERTARILETLPEVARREAEALDAVSLTLDHHGRGLRDGIGAVHEALSSIGRDLDLQGERTARALETIPEAIEREHETITHVARVLEGQSGTQLALAESVRDVPQMLALARDGQRGAEERLLALREVKHELELQREQRDRMVDLLRATSTRFEERMVQLEASMQQGATQARADAASLRLALDSVAERLTEQSRAESQREEARARRIEQGLHDVSRRLVEGNALQAAGINTQSQTIAALQDAHAELMDTFQRAQSRAMGEVQRFQDEAHRRAEQLAWRSRLALVGSAALVAVAVIVGVIARPDPAPVVLMPATAEAPSTSPAPTTIPAGFRRDAPSAPTPDERDTRFVDEAVRRERDDDAR